MTGTNDTNLRCIARAFAEQAGIGYQKALPAVRSAAQAGALPRVLNAEGRDLAVRLLLSGRKFGPLVEAAGSVGA